jgi:hypothetical protein
LPTGPRGCRSSTKVEARVSGDADPDFEPFVATIQTADAITVRVGQDILVGS